MPYKSYNEEEVDKVTEGIIKKHNVKMDIGPEKT